MGLPDQQHYLFLAAYLLSPCRRFPADVYPAPKEGSDKIGGYNYVTVDGLRPPTSYDTFGAGFANFQMNKWLTRQDLNLQPPPGKGVALPLELLVIYKPKDLASWLDLHILYCCLYFNFFIQT